MSNIKSFLDYKKIFEIDPKSIISDVMKYDEVQNELLYLNQVKQLGQGIDSKGQRIQTITAKQEGEGQVYSAYTIFKRAEKGLQVGNVDLKDTGDFYASMDIEVKEDSTEIVGEYQKSEGNILDNFDNKYDFLGLTNENLNVFGKWILSEILPTYIKLRFKL